MSAEGAERRYGPTSGTVSGYVGLALCVVVLSLALAAEPTAASVRVAIGAGGAGVLVWAYLLRPRVILDVAGTALELRNPLSSWRIPLEAVRVVAVKTITTVKTDDARYDAVAVGYPLRTLVREARPGHRGDDAARRQVPDEQSVMSDTILAAAERARVLRLTGPSATRSYAVIEIALLVIAALAFAATYLV